MSIILIRFELKHRLTQKQNTLAHTDEDRGETAHI